MHQKEQSQTNILQIEKKQCSRKSPAILIHKSLKNPKVANKKNMERNFPSSFPCPNPLSYTNS
jgi:hypothetical protein